MEKLALIAIGGGTGAVLRYWGVTWVGRLMGAGYMGTAFVNVLGSFLMGILAVIMIERFPDASGRYAPLLMTGILGGFTTFSAFSLDAMTLIERGRMLAAGGYVMGSVVLSIAGLAAGLLFARWWLS